MSSIVTKGVSAPVYDRRFEEDDMFVRHSRGGRYVFVMEIVDKIIQIGRQPDFSAMTMKLLKAVEPYDEINRLGWETWDAITKKMSMDDLIALIKGLTLAEELHNWCGGSVSAVIWTYRTLQRRDSKLATQLGNWILPRTSNCYIPFGGNNFGAHSIEDYGERKVTHQRIKACKARERVCIEKRAEDERMIRAAQRKRSHQDRNTEKRRKLKEEIEALPIEEQLRRIAEDTTYAVNFYPTACAGKATYEIIDDLDQEIKLKLVERMKGKFKGPWSKFKARLLYSVNGVDRWGSKRAIWSRGR